ncbi:hypothetical protein BX600DRAFT_444591 [Xylariales sp. PMI_506]|nr:hypothetical protein BX600DRAFT_444591 [Xylariales sp. PMI_506]
MGIEILPSHSLALVYEGVFELWKSSPEYVHWKNDSRAWQLRCLGGPGSGKTKFSAVVVQDLRSGNEAKENTVISIFLQDSSRSYGQTAPIQEPLLVRLLQEIAWQLGQPRGSVYSCVNPPPTIETHSHQIAQDFTQIDLKELRAAIHTRLGIRRRAFLVLDDLDLAWDNPLEYRQIEDELAAFQKSGLKIFTSSRIPVEPYNLRIICDVDDYPTEHTFWWKCSICLSEDICDPCRKRGKGCPKLEHKEVALTQPRERVGLSMGNIPWEDFIKYCLERDHGDLGFNSGAFDSSTAGPPPLSTLGRHLCRQSIDNKPSPAALTLVETLSHLFYNNITIALLRLENYLEAESLEDISVGDRLPQNIVNTFNASMARIAGNVNLTRRKLGVYAIHIIAHHGRRLGLRFDDLCIELRKRWSHDDLSELEISLQSEASLEQVLSATAGFLTANDTLNPFIRCYHPDFYTYLAEGHYQQVFGMTS